MWYLAELLFADPPHPDRADYQCEACNVVFQAADVVEAYRKAIVWGLDHASEPSDGMRLLGVSHLTTVGQKLGDGTEICGRFFEAPAVWDRVEELVPLPGQLKAVLWEQGRDVPIGKLLSPDQVAQLKRAWSQDAESGAASDGGE